MEPAHLREDLRNDVALVLLTKPDELIIMLADKNELKFYATRIILNMVISNSSAFTKLYRGKLISYNGDRKHMEYEDPDCEAAQRLPVQEINGRVVRELKEDAVMRFVNTELYWYDKEIMKMYARLGSFRKIEAELGIPWESCYSTVKKCIKRIREEVLNVTE